MPHYLKGVYTGTVKHKYNMYSAIDKQRVDAEIYLSPTGLAGDECADGHHHGGAQRALHQYPSEHYRYWQEKYAVGADWQAPGMGENMSSKGMTEKTVHIGERYRWGEAVIEVSQPRSPCFKLNKRWGIADFSSDMQAISRCGWLYRVIQPGQVSVEEPLVGIGHAADAMSLYDICAIFFGDPLNRQGLQRLEQQHKLSDSWRNAVVRRLQTRQVEDWQKRLVGMPTSE